MIVDLGALAVADSRDLGIKASEHETRRHEERVLLARSRDVLQALLAYVAIDNILRLGDAIVGYS